MESLIDKTLCSVMDGIRNVDVSALSLLHAFKKKPTLAQVLLLIIEKIRANAVRNKQMEFYS